MRDLEAYVSFIQEAEGLKSVTRTSWTASGRRESTAEHSWRLALLAWALLDQYPGLDKARVLSLCLIHDLGERYDGDHSASDHPDPVRKEREERAAIARLAALLPPEKGEEFRALWEEYEHAATPEARFVKAMDKAETILQHNQGANPPDFDYDFNLGYGAAFFENDGLLRELRVLLDEGTRARMEIQSSALSPDGSSTRTEP